MKIIPVIDILNGKVVHAVRGKRSEYQPLVSVLCKSTDPLEVARCFGALSFNELYVADIDAIIDCSDDLGVFRRLANGTSMKLMVDAGVTSEERAKNLLENGVSKLVIGTETLQKKDFVADALDAFGSDHVIVSLDLKDDKVLTRPSFDGCTDAFCLLKEFEDIGLSQVIVLDLTRVGSNEGVNFEFLRKIREKVRLSVYVGGGVRDIEDLVDLREIGVSGVLVASALHSGKISVQALKQANLL